VRRFHCRQPVVNHLIPLARFSCELFVALQPARERRAFAQRLLEEALVPTNEDEDPFYRAAIEVNAITL